MKKDITVPEQHCVGDRLTVDIIRPAHQGVGIARLDDGFVVMVRGGLTGDTVYCQLEKVKKSFAQARVLDVVVPSEHRVAQRCPAAAKGAGCCDMGHVDPDYEIDVKKQVLIDQLTRVGKLNDDEIDALRIDTLDFHTPTAWRTRMRLGVDEQGRAGVRMAGSHAIVRRPCSQAVNGLLDGLVGEDAARFTPGVDLVVVMDSQSHRTVVEVAKPARGKRAETVTRIVEGTGQAVQTVEDVTWTLPATSFWQAHKDAPRAFTRLVESETARLLKPFSTVLTNTHSLCGWDLYGGAGLLAPALGDGIDRTLISAEKQKEAAGATQTPTKLNVYSVESFKPAVAAGKKALADLPVEFFAGQVGSVISTLPRPAAVVLDPPRTGTTKAIVDAIALARPSAVVHIGCDPATFSRDVKSWRDAGYLLDKVTVVNAFPATSHVEVFGALRPA